MTQQATMKLCYTCSQEISEDEAHKIADLVISVFDGDTFPDEAIEWFGENLGLIGAIPDNERKIIQHDTVDVPVTCAHCFVNGLSEVYNHL